MTVALLIPAAEAATFTFGCALIHAHRHHADRVTAILTLVACALVLGIVFVVTPAEVMNDAARAEMLADVGSFPPIEPM